MIYVKVHIFHPQEELAKPSNLRKFQEPIGGAIRIMKCCKEYMVLVGEIKKN